jgi:hypothetical protein
MRLPRLASVTAATFAAGLAGFAGAPAAEASAHPAGSAGTSSAVITSVPMLPGPAVAQDGEPGPAPVPGWWTDYRVPGRPGTPRVWLKVSLGAPMFGGDYNEMYYPLEVQSSPYSRDTATGLVVRASMLECTRKDEPDVFCAHTRRFYEHIGALAPGQAYNGALPVELPNNAPTLYLRYTAELVHVDELTPGATPGTCSHGLHPSDLCASTLSTLLH